MPALTRFEHIQGATGFVGLQIVFVTLSGEGVAHFKALGFTQSEIAIVLLSGPLCGAVFQLFFGRWSDQLHTRWGRRKPFIIIGAITLVPALLCLAWVDPITRFIVSATLFRDSYHPATVLAAEFFMFTIWVAIQAIQVGLRALITDDCSRNEQAYASAWASRCSNLAAGTANLIAYLDILPRESKLDPSSGTFQNMSLLASVALLVTTSISCWGRGTKEDEKPFPDDGSDMSLTELWRTLFKEKSQVRTICLVQVFAWMGWFPFLFYAVTSINQLQHQELIRTGLPSPIVEHSDPRRGLLAYSIFGFVSLASTIFMPSLVTQWRLITMRKLWMTANSILAVFLVSASFTAVSAPLVLLCGAVGFSWAVSSWVPYALLGAETSLPIDDSGRQEDAIAPVPEYECAQRGEASTERGDNSNKDRKNISKHVGLLYGIHNLAISFPQVVFSLVIGLEGLYRSRGGAESDSGEALGWIFAVGGLSAMGAIYVSRGIRED